MENGERQFQKYYREYDLVMPIPHTKYTRVLYTYITGGFNYSNPYGVPEVNMPVLSRYHIISLLRGGQHNLYMTACSVPECNTRINTRIHYGDNINHGKTVKFEGYTQEVNTMVSHDTPIPRKNKGENQKKKPKSEYADSSLSDDGRTYGIDRLSLGEPENEP